VTKKRTPRSSETSKLKFKTETHLVETVETAVRDNDPDCSRDAVVE